MLDWGESICHRYLYIVLYIYRSAKFGVLVFKASVFLRGDLPVDLTTSAKCGVVVCKASMLNCRGAMCHAYMCIVLYMKLMWCNAFAEIYTQLEGSGGVNLLYVYVHSSRYI